MAEGFCGREDGTPATFLLYVEDGELWFVLGSITHVFDKPGALFDYLESNKIALPEEQSNEINKLVAAGFEFIKYFAEYLKIDMAQYLSYDIESDVLVEDPTIRIRELCDEYIKEDYTDVVYNLVLSSTLEMVDKAKEICEVDK